MEVSTLTISPPMQLHVDYDIIDNRFNIFFSYTVKQVLRDHPVLVDHFKMSELLHKYVE